MNDLKLILCQKGGKGIQRIIVDFLELDDYLG